MIPPTRTQGEHACPVRTKVRVLKVEIRFVTGRTNAQLSARVHVGIKYKKVRLKLRYGVINRPVTVFTYIIVEKAIRRKSYTKATEVVIKLTVVIIKLTVVIINLKW